MRVIFDHVEHTPTYGIRACAIKEPRVLHFSAFHSFITDADFVKRPCA